MKKTTIIIEKDSSGFSAYSDGLQTVLHGSGATVDEAKAELMAGYEDVKKYYQESGEPIPEELENLSFDFKYDISALFDDFAFLNITKFAQRIGISPSLMRHYKKGDTYISANQAKKIQNGLHQIADEFLSVTL